MHNHDKRNKVIVDKTQAIIESIIESMHELDITIPEFCLQPGKIAWRAGKEAEKAAHEDNNNNYK